MELARMRIFLEKHWDLLQYENLESFIYECVRESLFDENMMLFKELDIRVPTTSYTLPRKVVLDITKMPSYIRDVHFAVWFNKFNQLLTQIGFSEFDRDKVEIDITFSDELKKRTYGNLSIDEIKQKIKDEWGNSKKLTDILNKIHDKESLNKLIQELVRILCELRKEGDRRNPEKIHHYLTELEFEADILGEYHPESRQIVLYTKNIEKAAGEHVNTTECEFEKVFAHELFHAYHYSRSDYELTERNDYTSKVVKESLASAFEWFYCNETKINGCDSLEKTWYQNSVEFYPYSGAKHLVTLDDKKLNKQFKTVFDTSLNDVDVAMRAFLYSHEFYGIKNAITVERKITKVTIPPTDLRKAFDTLMKMDAIGIIAQREIPSIIRKNRLLIPNLLDTNYCENTFGLTAYPVLSITPMYDDNGHPRSYADPVLRIGKTDYYLCKEWQTQHLERLLDWIWENR